MCACAGQRVGGGFAQPAGGTGDNECSACQVGKKCSGPVRDGHAGLLEKVRLCEWWTGHHGTATALGGATSQTAGATRNTGYSLTICSKSTSGARRVIGKNGRAPAEISRYRRNIAARLLEKSCTKDQFSRLPSC